ncbi:hypothetical protein LCGC14_0527030, partial [marine sediment metagenome]
LDTEVVSAIEAASPLTLPAFTLGGTMDANSQALINVLDLDLGTESATGTFSATLTAANAGTAWLIKSKDTSDILRPRLGLSGGVDTAVWAWVNSTHTGIVLSGALTLNGQTFDAGSGSLRVDTTGSNEGIDIYATSDDGGVRCSFYHVTASPVANDIPFQWYVYGKDTGGTQRELATQRFLVESVGATTLAGKMDILLRTGAAWNTALTLSSAGALWIDAGLEVGGNIVMGGSAITGHAQAISDNAVLTVDHVTPVSGDYAKFTANGLEGREKSEVLSDLNVEDGADVSPIKFVYKGTAETVNNSDVLQDDDAFTFSVLANKAYKVDLWLLWFSGTTPDLKLQWSGPVGAGGDWLVGENVTSIVYSDFSSAIVLQGQAAYVISQIHCLLTTGANAGAITLQWAQNVANGSNTIIHARSWMSYALLN